MEKTRITEIGSGQVDGKVYTKKKIALINPPKRDIMGGLHKLFTRSEVALAKSEYKLAVAEGQNITTTL